MKKTIIFVVIILMLSTFLFVACNGANINNNGSVQNESSSKIPNASGGDKTENGANLPDNENTEPKPTDNESGNEPSDEETIAPEPKPGDEENEDNKLANPPITYKTYAKALATVNVRSSAGLSNNVLGSINTGDMLAYKGTNGSWNEVWYRGKSAYVSANYTELYKMQISEKYEKAISIGEKLLGTPYVYGAVRLHNGNGVLAKSFDVNKFDCSSLVQYMYYYGQNVNLGLTTRTQCFDGKKVDKSDMERGTVMFFTNSSRYYNTGTSRIGHVGVYLGNNYILHTASDYAIIEPISSTRWSYFITARNM